ncbi:MAG: M48 family metallopeptidase [Caldilineales bacterium]|nr:M48 family metallopeptidase [Caldilineales bacterium]
MEVRIVRSGKRRKTIQAREVDGVMEVLAPAAMSDEELAPHIARLQQRLQNRKQKAKLDDDLLEKRARALNREYFEGRLQWESLRWVSNQNKRYGSCSPHQGTIRISHRIAAMPRFVIDYVLVHELAHLLEANHGPRFWRLVNRYPRTERARGYLMAAGLEEVDE